VSAFGDRSQVVADDLWGLVRRLAGRVAALEEVAAAGELDEDGRARLDALRLKCARAAARAGMADELSDRVADVRARRGRA
jgi:hypothetical protein